MVDVKSMPSTLIATVMAHPTLSLFAIVVSLALLSLFAQYRKFRRWVTQYPTEPGTTFLRGTVEFDNKARAERRIRDYHVERATRLAFGKGEVYQGILPLALGRVIHVFDPEWVELVLNHYNAPKYPFLYSRIQYVSGKHGIFTLLDQEEWVRSRKPIAHAFAPANIRAAMPALQEGLERLVENLDHAAHKSNYALMDKLFVSLTLDFIGEIAFGVRFGLLDPSAPKNSEAAELLSLFNSTLQEVLDCFENPLRALGYKAETRAMWRDTKRMREIVQKIIEVAIESKSHADNSIFGSMLKIEGMTLQAIADNVVTFLFAGHDTTAHSMAFTLYYLLVTPDAFAKARAEVDQALGERVFATHDLISQLPYLTMCIKESLRMATPAPATFRVMPETRTLNGLTIEKGEIVACHFEEMHYNPQFFPEPEKYIPERWTKENEAARHKFAYAPFGAGPRDCVGKVLAMNELQLTLATLLHRYDFEFQPGWQFWIENRLANKLGDDLPLKLTLRAQ